MTSPLAAAIAGLIFLAAFALAIAVIVRVIRRREMQYWLGSYCFPNVYGSRRYTPEVPHPFPKTEPVNVFIAVCDHFEPEVYRPDPNVARERVRRWRRAYPECFSRFADSRGRPPQHTFFFPQDEYKPEYLDPLKELCEAGFGDVDIHLHHDNDTQIALTEKLETFKQSLFHRHDLLRCDPATGEIVYGFIHGNWALCNSRPDGRWCGVANELTVLRDTGCYADFTMPSAPDEPTQTSTINSIYYATDRPGQVKSHDVGIPAALHAAPPENSLLIVQGPLVLDWTDRKFGFFPRTENGDLHATRPPRLSRFLQWMRADVHVAGRPDWRFVKLHTHGCKPGNIDMWLNGDMERFHDELAAYAKQNDSFRYFYVTTWEMAQLVHQAEAGVKEPVFQSTDELCPVM